jgi:hypothetical protein
MSGARRLGAWVVPALALLGAPAVGLAQSATASLCPLLPLREVESLFGAPPAAPVGMDMMPNIGNCGVQFPDPERSVSLSTTSLVGQGGMNLEERTRLGLQLMEQSGTPSRARFEYFGAVVCATEEARPPVRETMCMTDRGQRQLTLLVRSDDPRHVGVSEVRRLLDATVAGLN